MDLAFFRLPDGRAWIGEGPFVESAVAPEGAAFYINDFTLSDPAPWRTPARMAALGGAAALEEFIGGAEVPRIEWRRPGTERFTIVFRGIRRDVMAGRLRKMVPVLTERGRLVAGDMTALLRRLLDAPAGFWGYARIRGDAGFMGASPETLLERKGRTLETMALAGTAKPSAADEFATDGKEIREHELVANFLEDTLSGVGVVRRGSREVSVAGGLTHFRTPFSATLRLEVSDDDLVRLLHPTPAVGCLPRDEVSLRRLMECRRRLGTGDHFGAPFGLRLDGEFHCAVAIRGISWSGREVRLPCGCGIVEGSTFDHEWRELRQKREAVASLLGV